MTRAMSSLVLALVVASSSIQAQSAPIVMIDPGHGGEDAGVVAGEILEKDVALSAALALGEAFLGLGYDIRLTRTGDYTVGWDERRATAEEVGAVLFVSLHFNGDEDPAADGIEIYVNLEAPGSTGAAEDVAASLRELGSAVVIEGRPWGFLKSAIPTVMLEAGFLTNPEEQQLILSPAYQHELAVRIAEGSDLFLSGD